jgi:hypothetical protein
MLRPVAHVLPAVAVVLAAGVYVASCTPVGRGPQAAAPTRLASQPATSPSGASPPGPSPSAPPATSAPPVASVPPSPGASSPGAAPGSPAGPSRSPRQSRGSVPGPPQPPAPPPGCDGQRWQTVAANLPRAVRTPPVPFLTGIRMGTHPHCRFDRVVIHFLGRVPGYQVKYVSARSAGRAARSLANRGDHYLMITVYPAQSHRRSGQSTVSPVSARAAFPVLRGYSVASDFEGVVSVVAVVTNAPPFRVGILHKRLYVDVYG